MQLHEIDLNEPSPPRSPSPAPERRSKTAPVGAASLRSYINGQTPPPVRADQPHDIDTTSSHEGTESLPTMTLTNEEVFGLIDGRTSQPTNEAAATSLQQLRDLIRLGNGGAHLDIERVRSKHGPGSLEVRKRAVALGGISESDLHDGVPDPDGGGRPMLKLPGKTYETVRLRCTETPINNQVDKMQENPNHSHVHCFDSCTIAIRLTGAGDPYSPPNTCELNSILHDRVPEVKLLEWNNDGNHCHTKDAVFTGDSMVKLALGICEHFGFTRQTLVDAAKYPCGFTDMKLSAKVVNWATTETGLSFYMRHGFVGSSGRLNEESTQYDHDNFVFEQHQCQWRRVWCAGLAVAKARRPHTRELLKHEYTALGKELDSAALSLDKNRGGSVKICLKLQDVVKQMESDMDKAWGGPGFYGETREFARRTGGLTCDGHTLKNSDFKKDFCPFPSAAPQPDLQSSIAEIRRVGEPGFSSEQDKKMEAEAAKKVAGTRARERATESAKAGGASGALGMAKLSKLVGCLGCCFGCG